MENYHEQRINIRYENNIVTYIMTKKEFYISAIIYKNNAFETIYLNFNSSIDEFYRFIGNKNHASILENLDCINSEFLLYKYYQIANF
jgi:hypothetical protein